MTTHNTRILPQRAATLRGEKFRFHDKFYLYSTNETGRAKPITKGGKKIVARKKNVQKVCQQFKRQEWCEPASQFFEEEENRMTYKDLENDNVSEFPDHYWDGQAFIENNQLFSEGQGLGEEMSENQPETQMDSEHHICPQIFLKGAMREPSFTCGVQDFWKSKYSELKMSSFPSSFKR